MNSITTRTKRALSGVIAAIFALSLVAIPSAALAAAPFFGPEATNTSQTILIGEGLTALTASDPDGDPLTFFLIAGGLPDGITLNADGTFSGLATTAGDFSPWIQVCDPFDACALTTIAISVSSPNQAPSFGPEGTNTSQSVTVGQGLNALTASDPEGDALIFSLQGGSLPDGITLNADGTFSGLATTAGDFSALNSVCDPFAECATATLTVTVVVNHPPTFGPEATNTSQAILIGEGLTALTAFDPDGDSIHFSLQGGVLPDGITLNDDGTFSGLATTTGDTSAITAVCDGSGVLCDSLTLEVTVSAPNQAPFFGPEDTNTSQAITVGQGLTALTASDPDGDALNFSLSAGSLPDGITLNADGTFSGLATTAGLFSAFIQVCDPFAACDSLTLEVTVSAPTNQAPFFGADSTNNNQAIAVGEGLTALTASDPDGDPLTFSLNGFALPDGITLNADGTFSGLATTVGDFMALNEVCDPLGDCDYVTLLVTVSAPPNQAPSFVDVDPTNTSQAILIGEGLTALTASDPDGDALTFSLSAGGLPDGITLNADGTFSGVATTAGNFGAMLSVCDPLDACDTTTLTVTVSPINQAPSFGPDSTNTAQDIAVGEGLAALLASDPDGDPLTFFLMAGGLPEGITLNADGTFSGLATAAGDFSGDINVCDPSAACDTTTLTVSVSDPSASPNQSPSFGPETTNTFQAIAIGQGLTALLASDPDGDPLTFSFSAGVLPEGITLNADGTFSGLATAAGDFSGDINVCDPSAACDTTTLTVTVSSGITPEPSASPTPEPSVSPSPDSPSPSASPIVTPSPQPKVSTPPQPKVSTLSLANTSIEGPLGTPAQLQILLGLLLLSLGSGPLASKWLRRRFLRQR